MKDVTKPVADPFTGGRSFIRAMAKQLASIQPFESFSEWEWKWFREWLSKSQIEEGLTQAFEYGPNPSHSLVFNILEAARSRVEDGLPPYGDLWARPTPEETQRAIEERKKRMEGYHL